MHINSSHEISVKGDVAERCDSRIYQCLVLFTMAQVMIKMTVKYWWAGSHETTA